MGRATIRAVLDPGNSLARGGPLPSPVVRRWAELTAPYERCRTRVLAPGWRLTHFGDLPVLVTAPHAVSHTREHRRKRAEWNTGGLAEVVAELVGATSLATHGALTTDPNWDAVSDFKDQVAELVAPERFVIDIHGMADERPMDACIAVGPAPDRATMELAVFALGRARQLGLDVRINDPFDALRPTTITAFVQEHCHARALEIELPMRNRDPDGRPERAAVTVEWLEAVARAAGKIAG